MAHSKSPHLLIVGAGSVGLLLASVLRRGRRITLLCRPQRYTQLRRGLKVSFLKSRIEFVTKERDLAAGKILLEKSGDKVFRREFDLIIVTVKSKDVDDVLSALKGHYEIDQEVLVIKNGLFRREKLLLGIASLGVYYEKGRLVSTGGGDIAIGRLNGNLNGIRKLLPIIRNPYISLSIARNFGRKYALKIGVNSVVNSLSAVLTVENGVLEREDLKPILSLLTDEVASLLSHLSLAHGVDAGTLGKAIHQVISLTRSNRSSMLRDIETGRKTESEYLLGGLLKLSGRDKKEFPISNLLVKLIRILEDSYVRNALMETGDSSI